MANNEPIYSYTIVATYGDGAADTLLDLDGLTLKEVNNVTRAGNSFMNVLTDISDDVIDGTIPQFPSSGTKAEVQTVATILKGGSLYARQTNQWPNMEPWEWYSMRGVLAGSVRGGVDRSVRGKGRGKKG